MATPRRIAQPSHQVHVLGRVNELELGDGRLPRRQQVSVLDEAGRADELDRQLDADGLQRVLVREVVFHQLFAIDQSHRSRHGHVG